MRDERTDEQTTGKDRATQLLICEPLSFAMCGRGRNMMTLENELIERGSKHVVIYQIYYTNIILV